MRDHEKLEGEETGPRPVNGYKLPASASDPTSLDRNTKTLFFKLFLLEDNFAFTWNPLR